MVGHALVFLSFHLLVVLVCGDALHLGVGHHDGDSALFPRRPEVIGERGPFVHRASHGAVIIGAVRLPALVPPRLKQPPYLLVQPL